MGVKDDETAAYGLACNCLLYEEDPGPAELNIGTETEPKMVPRRQAWRELYSRLLAETLEAEAGRLVAAREQCRASLAETYQPGYWEDVQRRRAGHGDPTAGQPITEQDKREIREVWECATELCDLALTMVRQSGAADDDPSRERLLAGLRHANTADVLRGIPGVVEDSARQLTERLNELDE